MDEWERYFTQSRKESKGRLCLCYRCGSIAYQQKLCSFAHLASLREILLKQCLFAASSVDDQFFLFGSCC